MTWAGDRLAVVWFDRRGQAGVRDRALADRTRHLIVTTATYFFRAVLAGRLPAT